MPSSALSGLESIVGKENISVNPRDTHIYSFDSSQLKGKALAVVWPSSTGQVQKIMQYASKKNIPITPRGGGTSLVGGAVPENSVVLDTSRMDSIIRENSDTITVEAGMIISDLNIHLAKKNLYFPVIPSSDTVATIGGMLSTDAAGTRAIRYGRASEWAEELELVTGSGDIIKTRAIKEFAGTEGILAVITKATLRLTNPPEHTSITTYSFSTAKDMVEVVKEHLKRKDVIAIEYIDPLTSQHQGGDSSYNLFIEYDSLEGTYRTEEEINRAWKLRKGLATVLSSAGYPVIEDPRIPLEHIPAFLDWLEEKGIPNFGHIGYGIIHCRLKKGADLKSFYVKVRENQGNVSGEHGIGLTKKEYIADNLKHSLREKKQKYDPKNILNRGKMI